MWLYSPPKLETSPPHQSVHNIYYQQSRHTWCSEFLQYWSQTSIWKRLWLEFTLLCESEFPRSYPITRLGKFRDLLTDYLSNLSGGQCLRTRQAKENIILEICIKYNQQVLVDPTRHYCSTKNRESLSLLHTHQFNFIKSIRSRNSLGSFNATLHLNRPSVCVEFSGVFVKRTG